MIMVFMVILVALAFEYINGFHDTANSIATVVSTKVLTPRQAVILAACTNLAGALCFTAVAKTIAGGLVDTTVVTLTSGIIVCTLIGAIAWNLLTWWLGLPSSSSHALIGGLCGAAFAASHNNPHVIIWAVPSATHWWLGTGLWWKVIVPMFTSPIAGFILGFVFMAILYLALHKRRPQRVNRFFGVAQIFSSGLMGFMHGTNDAQKTMGIIALTLMGATSTGQFDHLPAWLSFLRTEQHSKSLDIAVWIKVLCACTMASGTAVGGWRIIKTLGHKMVKLHPINGFAAEASSAAVIGTATLLGIPVSTTHNISAAIMGVGSAKRFNAIKWSVVERMVWAWIFTLPVTAGIAYILVWVSQVLGWTH